MKIQIKTEILNFPQFISLKLFNQLKSDLDSIEFVKDFSENLNLYIFLIENEFCFEYFGLKKIVQKKDVILEFDKLIASFLGFQYCEVAGMTVKNASGEKEKPIIQIFIKNNSEKMPISLKYMKGSYGSSFKQEKIEIFSDSKILSDILKGGPLYFKSEDSKICKIFFENNNKLFISVDEISKSAIECFLSNDRQNNQIQKFDKNYNSMIEEILEKIENDYSFKIKEIDKLFSIVENAPHFNNFMDTKIEKIENFLIQKQIYVNTGHGEYLQFKQQRMPFRKAEGSLFKFLNNSK